MTARREFRHQLMACRGIGDNGGRLGFALCEKTYPLMSGLLGKVASRVGRAIVAMVHVTYARLGLRRRLNHGET